MRAKSPSRITLCPRTRTMVGSICSVGMRSFTWTVTLVLLQMLLLRTRRGTGTIRKWSQSPIAWRLFLDFPVRIPGDFPEVAVQILEVSGVSSPKAVVRRVSDFRSCLCCLLHHRIDFLFGFDVMADGE